LREPNHAALKAALDAGLFDICDPGIGLFQACLKAGAPMTFASGMHVLEAGCCEADWLHAAHKAWPGVQLTGVDWRAPDAVSGDGKVTRRKGNLLDPAMFEQETFDACVSLSAIEHMGLGHYSKDPLDVDGDSKVVANIWRWLKPGGWFYLDVPYDPTGYRVQGTECRVYDDWAIFERLKYAPRKFGCGGTFYPPESDVFRGYVHAKEWNTLIPKPTEAVKPFYYVACVWKKI
jgi:SAM-dependent methyltransferase